MDEERPPEDRIDFVGLERLSPSAPPPKEKRGSTWTKLAAFLVPIAVLAAVPWLILTRVVHTSTPTPTPSVSVSHTPTASASPSTSAAKGRYEVANLKTCLRIHDEPGTTTTWFDCLTPGVQLDSDGQTAETDGIAWLHVHDPYKKKDGWAAGSYLRKVA